ncbi:MAG: hypothetical protein L6R37_001488 [Teloschistes peruensis]|nr:MAG: hypothetical protein L6R37_001488 [Teloschistes peruensis]
MEAHQDPQTMLSSPSTPPTSPSAFLMLPREIRDTIYGCFEDERDICHSLWVCRQLYNETHHLFYDRFALELENFQRPGGSTCRLTRRLKSMPEMSGPLLKKVDIFIPSLIWELDEVRLRGVHRGSHICRPGFKVRKLGLSPELSCCLGLATNPELVVSVFYRLRGNPKAFRQRNADFQEINRQMINLFTKDLGFPACKRLVLCCDSGLPQLYWQSPDDGRLEWSHLCNTLASLMEQGSWLQHLEIWFTKLVLASDVKYVEQPLEDLWLHDPQWLEPLARIHGLRSVKVMAWETLFPFPLCHPTMQAKPIGIEGFDKVLKSKVVTIE